MFPVAQFGVPGGPELILVLIIAVVLFGVPLVVLGGVAGWWLRIRGDEDPGPATEERVAELEREVEELRRDRED